MPTQAAAPARARNWSALGIRISLWLALSVVSLLWLWPVAASTADAPRLFVFVTTDIRTRAWEQELQAGLPGIDVHAFSRVADLKRVLTTRSPDALLAHSAVLESLGMTPDLQGYRGGDSREPYALLSVRRAFQPQELAGAKVGAVDVLGRKAMLPVAEKILGVSTVQFKWVLNERDLLPLLQFEMVSAVLLPERWVATLAQTSELDLKATRLPTRVTLPGVAFRSESARESLASGIRSISDSLNLRLGVDQWK